ncbi:hypothetical protein BaRGS_00021347 [Batillaria attramentaria]|uniref:Uncharacterized protein n=1 Tax=Batillaria attramentaria TaxID=370345 RepID=A0ABD0KJZ3_9CAEN
MPPPDDAFRPQDEEQGSKEEQAMHLTQRIQQDLRHDECHEQVQVLHAGKIYVLLRIKLVCTFLRLAKQRHPMTRLGHVIFCVVLGHGEYASSCTWFTHGFGAGHRVVIPDGAVDFVLTAPVCVQTRLENRRTFLQTVQMGLQDRHQD